MALKKKVAKKTAKKTMAKKAPVSRKKATVRKKVATGKKAVARKATVASSQKSMAARQTKIQILQHIAEDTNLSRKQVADVFGSLSTLIQRHIQRRGSGEFTIPETGVKIRRVVKPARKARMGRNPATGEVIKIPAKRASTAIKLTPLKQLKDMYR